MNCTLQAQKIYEACVMSAKRGKTLSYREVQDYFGYGNRVQGHSIRHGLEFTWTACVHTSLPILVSIIVTQATGALNADGYTVENWKEDANKVFKHQEWLHVTDIDWDYVWNNRVELSNIHGTRGYWTKD